MKKKVLAVAGKHPGSINAILPVIKQLKLEERVILIPVGRGYSETILKNEGINHNIIGDYSLEDISHYSVDKILQIENPDLVLVGTTAQDDQTKYMIEQTITLAARRKNIPTLAVLDVWMNYSLRFNDIHTNEKFKYLPDNVAIMDEYAEKEMLKEGFEKENLVITGNPYYDDLTPRAKNFTAEENQEIRKQIGLTTNFLIFYAANSWKSYSEEFGFWDLDNIGLISEVITNLPEQQRDKISLVAKLHPRTPESDLSELNKYVCNAKIPIKLITETKLDAKEFILASDLTLTPHSTLAFVTVYMSRPCISLQPGLKTIDYIAILTENGIIPVGYSKEDSKKLVKQAILDDNYREKELIEKASSFRTDGKATERVTNLVYEMLDIH